MKSLGHLLQHGMRPRLKELRTTPSSAAVCSSSQWLQAELAMLQQEEAAEQCAALATLA
jgi:hypothetical protein